MAMTLVSASGDEFELAFIRDSFADAQDGVGDANWATVNFRVATEASSWEETAPCLNFYEFRALAEWLERCAALREGDPEPAELELLQPELRFRLLRQSPELVTIRIWFHLEDRPEEFIVDTPTDELEFLDLPLERGGLLLAAEQLRQDLRDFEAANLKDDLTGDAEHGVFGDPREDADALDTVSPTPPGMSIDEDEGYIEQR